MTIKKNKIILPTFGEPLTELAKQFQKYTHKSPKLIGPW